MAEKTKTILVAGAAGFIGSHLVDRLLSQGHWVIGIDNLHTGDKHNLVDAFKSERFAFHEHDVRELLKMNVRLDEIYNLAAPASPVHYQKSHVYTAETNAMGIMNLALLAVTNKAKLLQASTSEVYGDPLMHPQPEYYHGDVNPFGPRSCYDEGKRFAEAYLYAYKNDFNLRIKIARIFNTYGPRMAVNDGRAVPNFIVNSLLYKPVVLYGSGSQTRSLMYIDDLIDGLIALMESRDEITGPINLGNPDEVKMYELACQIIDITKSKSDLKYEALPQNDPARRKPNIELAKIRLNWEPKVSRVEGLKRTIKYFKKQVK